ncbi:hypothetical protein GGX14DRAFT_404570 [Mycena pura]|uniref:Uncharacterized protein n=1 Tax=Mycena pura TaxID=153505 RepID=A0AAD6UXF2_9AGAR|nr:hypothetical protein GGX14DRAFT_404570 [Mycena pura]
MCPSIRLCTYTLAYGHKGSWHGRRWTISAPAAWAKVGDGAEGELQVVATVRQITVGMYKPRFVWMMHGCGRRMACLRHQGALAWGCMIHAVHTQHLRAAHDGASGISHITPPTLACARWPLVVLYAVSMAVHTRRHQNWLAPASAPASGIGASGIGASDIGASGISMQIVVSVLNQPLAVVGEGVHHTCASGIVTSVASVIGMHWHSILMVILSPYALYIYHAWPHLGISTSGITGSTSGIIASVHWHALNISWGFTTSMNCAKCEILHSTSARQGASGIGTHLMAFSLTTQIQYNFTYSRQFMLKGIGIQMGAEGAGVLVAEINWCRRITWQRLSQVAQPLMAVRKH